MQTGDEMLSYDPHIKDKESDKPLAYTRSGFSENFPRHLETQISVESLVRNHSNQFEMSELHSLA